MLRSGLDAGVSLAFAREFLGQHLLVELNIIGGCGNSVQHQSRIDSVQ